MCPLGRAGSTPALGTFLLSPFIFYLTNFDLPNEPRYTPILYLLRLRSNPIIIDLLIFFPRNKSGIIRNSKRIEIKIFVYFCTESVKIFKTLKKPFQILLNLFPRPFLIRVSLLLRPLLISVYKGKKYKDPIDGETFSKFLPYGYENERENVLSPSTLSLERHRLLWLYLQNKTDFFTEQQKVLHFAPEQAFYKRFRNLENLEYTTTDLNSPIADVKADICDLPFRDNSFDTVICNHVLEHIADDTKAMKELFRILKSGGMAILQIPQDLSRKTTFEDNSITDTKERARIFGQYDHLRIYGRDFFDKLRSVGFTVEEVDYTSDLEDSKIDYYRLQKGEIIPVCYKP